ncbi:MAG TPA: CHAT domain-containing protein [Saprospiraceae bacterium]|nr:CHAT domain-containing protein [Saprospiraceae bacterium]HPI06194.1 CHAT domain-containing protein [Saprospiraceae bacterium]
MMKFYWIPVLLLLARSGRAQTDSLQAEMLVERAVACLSEGKKDSAALLHNRAQQMFQKQNLLKPWLKSYIVLAYSWADDLEQPFAGTDLIVKGISNAWRAPATPKEWEQVALAYVAAGHIRRANAGDFMGARDFYDQGYRIFEGKLNGQSDKIAKYLYHQLANIYTRFGDYPRAESLLRKGIAYGHAHPELGMADESDLALLMMETRRYEEALTVLNQGLALKDVGASALITMLENKAVALHALGRTDAALTALHKVPVLISRLSIDDDSLYYSMSVHSTEADIRMDQKMYGLAEQLYKKAIVEGEQHWETTQRREIAKEYCALGNLHLLQQKNREALSDFHQALRCVLRDFTTTDPNDLPDPASFISENTIMEALEGKALCFQALGQLEKSLACYELIPAAGGLLIATHAYESSSLLTLEEGRAHFDKAVEIAWQLYHKTGQRHYAERAFALTEQARAILLLQSIARARQEFSLPPEVRRQEQELSAKIAWYEQLIAAEIKLAANSPKLTQLRQALFQLKETEQQFQAELRRKYPDYAGLSDRLQFVSVNGVSSLLRNKQSMLAYYLTDAAAYVFYFSKKGAFSMRKADLPPLFRDQVLRYFNFMASNNENPADRNWYLDRSFEWFRLLLQPELDSDPDRPESLLVIPDDALAFIPFDVLLHETAQPDARWRDLPFLLKKYSIGYAYSATLWDMQQKISADHRKNPAPKFRFAGFAPSYGSNAPSGDTRSVQIPDSLIYDIKSTQVELAKVHALMGGQAFAGLASSEQQFKQIAPDCGILLLAMHGLANDEFPELSCLLFGRPKGDSVNNDVLFANELQVMQLQADLAVLSACHTGFGKLHKGEGVYSLARAFAVAGVPSTVMSIWRLHENAAPVLMEAFFKYLKAGKTKEEALRLAKLDFLNADEHYEMTHPFFWAGVTVSGDMCPLESSWKWWYWLAGGLVLLLFLVVWRRRY